MFSMSATSRVCASSRSRTRAGMRGEAGDLGRAPAALTGHEFVGAAGHRPYEHRLKQARLP